MIPVKNTQRGQLGKPFSDQFARHASNTPRFTPVCKTAAIHGRHLFGHVSESSDDPTAHSPPIPSAATKRKIINCHHVCAKNDRPVNTAYVKIVKLSARLRPKRSPTRPKNPPPNAQPIKNAA